MRSLDPSRPISVSRMHIQTAPKGVPQRLPFGTGNLEVLRIDRLRKVPLRPEAEDAESGSVRAFVELDGVPASSRSTVRKARLAFVEDGVQPPLSRVDPMRGLMRLYFPLSDHDRITELLRAGKRRMCYCWTTADSTRSVVMLMAMG